MSCCNSNFDGSDLEELEVSPYLDFDGEDQSIDADFDYLFKKGALKNIASKRKENRGENLSARAERTSDYDSCIRSKPLLASPKNWNNACRSAHPNTVSAGSNPAVNDSPADISGGGSSSGSSKPIAEAIKNIGEEFGMPIKNAGAGASASAEPMEEPKKAGILANKGLMIAGGVILLGLGIFAIRKFRK